MHAGWSARSEQLPPFVNDLFPDLSDPATAAILLVKATQIYADTKDRIIYALAPGRCKEEWTIMEWMGDDAPRREEILTESECLGTATATALLQILEGP